MGDKKAEQQFLERSGNPAWELQKPFSPPGQWTCPHSIDLIQEFVEFLGLDGSFNASLGAIAFLLAATAVLVWTAAPSLNAERSRT